MLPNRRINSKLFRWFSSRLKPYFSYKNINKTYWISNLSFNFGVNKKFIYRKIHALINMFWMKKRYQRLKCVCSYWKTRIKSNRLARQKGVNRKRFCQFTLRKRHMTLVKELTIFSKKYVNISCSKLRQSMAKAFRFENVDKQ